MDAYTEIETYSIQDPDFIFHSTSSGATASIRLHTKSSSVALKLLRNLFTGKIVSNMGDRVNLSAGQWTALMGAVFTEEGVPIGNTTL